MLACSEWRWISWTRNHIFHHGLAFPNLIFFVLFWVNRCVFPLSELLRVLIHLVFCNVLLVVMFYSKVFRFLLHSVVDMLSCHSPSPLVDKISVRCFRMACFISSDLPFADIFLIFLLSPVVSGLFPQVALLFFYVLHFPFCLCMFQCLFFILSF